MWAQSRIPMDVMRSGSAVRLRHALQQCESCPDAAGRADRAGQIGVGVALIGGLPWPRSAPGPLADKAVLLADPGLVLIGAFSCQTVLPRWSLLFLSILPQRAGSGVPASQQCCVTLYAVGSQAARTIMPLARGSAPTRHDPPETRQHEATKEEDGRAPRIAAGGMSPAAISADHAVAALSARSAMPSGTTPVST